MVVRTDRSGDRRSLTVLCCLRVPFHPLFPAWQRDVEDCATARRGFVTDLAVEPLDNLFDDAQAKTRAAPLARVGRVDLREFLKDAILEFVGDETEALSWNDRCDPPWDIDGGPASLSAKVANAYRYGQNAPGSKGMMFDSLGIAECTERAENEDRPLSAAELRYGNFPRSEALWEDFLLSGQVNLLYGDGGIGKTLLALMIAVAVAAGIDLFGRGTKQAPVYILLCEDDYGEVKARLLAICASLGVELADLRLRIWCRPGDSSVLARIDDNGVVTLQDFYGRFIADLEEFGPCLLITDTVTDIAELDEKQRLPVNALCKRVLGKMCREFGVTLLVTAHPSKRAIDDGLHYAGSTAWNNSVRNRLSFEALKGNKRKLFVAKSNYGLKGEIELIYGDGVFSNACSLANIKNEAAERDAVLEVLTLQRRLGNDVQQSQGNGFKIKDFIRILKEDYGFSLDANEVRDHLNRLGMAGKIHWRASKGGKNGCTATYELGPNPNSTVK